MGAPATLPADFFSTQQPQPAAAAQPASPDTLPANFFSQAQALPKEQPATAPDTLPSDFFSRTSGSAPSTVAPKPEAQGIVGKAWDFLNTPLTVMSGALPESREGAGPIERGVEKFASGFTSPLSVGLLIGTLGSSALAQGVLKAGLVATAADAAAVVQKVKLATDIGFLTKYGYDLGTKSIPALETKWGDYRSATNEKQKQRALDELKEMGTEAVLGAIASGLAAKGISGDIRDIEATSPKGRAMAQNDYADAVLARSARRRAASGEGDQYEHEILSLVKDPKAQAAIWHNKEAVGDPLVLESRAVKADLANKPELAAEIRAGKSLSPTEQKARDIVARVVQENGDQLRASDRLAQTSTSAGYMPHQYAEDYIDPATGKKAEHGVTSEGFLKKRVYDNIVDAELSGLTPIKNLPAMVADYHENAGNVLADDSFKTDLITGQTNAGEPLAVPARNVPAQANPANFVPSDLHLWMNGELVPLAINREIAPHVSALFEQAAPSRLEKLALKASSGAKSALLSLSPFHWATVTNRMLELAQNPFSTAKIDWHNLTPVQQDALSDGLMIGGRGLRRASEGLVPGKESLINRIPVVGGVNKLIEQNLFGPSGYLSRLKFSAYDSLRDSIQKSQPNLSPREAGRVAAAQVNNKFGGLNYEVLGRGANNQNALRLLMLAPDFLESTGRSILDVAGNSGSSLVKRLVAFNAAHWFAARAINYLVSGDSHPETGFSVRSKDGKREYGLRTTLGDFLHFVEQPRDFLANRVNPLTLRVPAELYTRTNQHGERISPQQQLMEVMRQITPIPAQGIFPTETISQQSAKDKLLQSIGVRSTKAFTPAETLAHQLATKRNGEGAPLEGDDLAKAQLRYKLEDNLRTAINARDSQARTDAIRAIHGASVGPDAKLTGEEASKLIAQANKYPMPLQSTVDHLALADALQVWDRASINEKRALRPIIQKKIERFQTTASTRTRKDNDAMRQQIQAFRFSLAE
jgi:hypothetical protein